METMTIAVCKNCGTEFFSEEPTEFCSERCQSLYEQGAPWSAPRCQVCGALILLPRHRKYRDIQVCSQCVAKRKVNGLHKYCQVCQKPLSSHLQPLGVCSLPCAIALRFVQYVFHPPKPLHPQDIHFNPSMVCQVCKQSLLHAKTRRKLMTITGKYWGNKPAEVYLMLGLLRGRWTPFLKKAHKKCESKVLARFITILKNFLRTQPRNLPETLYNLTAEYAELTQNFGIDMLEFIRKTDNQGLRAYLERAYGRFQQLGLVPPSWNVDELKRQHVEFVLSYWLARLGR
jgi:hypothetical protein